MTYTLYGAAGSGSVPVEAAMTLMNLPYRVVEAATWEGEAERERVAAVNPMRQVPALVTPDGEVLTESAAILIWLTDRHPEAGLAPGPGDARRGQFLRWMAFIPAAIYAMSGTSPRDWRATMLRPRPRSVPARPSASPNAGGTWKARSTRSVFFLAQT